MIRRSADILMHRKHAGQTEVLLVHLGGPFWKNRDMVHGLFRKANMSSQRSRKPLPGVSSWRRRVSCLQDG